MVFIKLLLLLPWLATTGWMASANVCDNSPYNNMKPFVNYEPAQKYCWDHYPGRTKWQTSSKPATTTTVTSTKTCTTTTTSTSTSTICTNYVDKLVKIYVNLKDRKRTPQTLYEAKRNAAALAAPTPNANDMSAAWAKCSSTMAKCGNNCFSTGCSCIESTRTSTRWVPATKTYTRTIKTSTTTTSTVTVTTKTSMQCTNTSTTTTTTTVGTSS